MKKSYFIASVLFAAAVIMLAGCSNKNARTNEPAASDTSAVPAAEAALQSTSAETEAPYEPVEDAAIAKQYVELYVNEHQGVKNNLYNIYAVIDEYNGEKVRFDINLVDCVYTYRKNASLGIDAGLITEDSVYLTAEEMDKVLGFGKSILAAYFPDKNPALYEFEPVKSRAEANELLLQYTLAHDGTYDERKKTYTSFGEYNGEKGKIVIDIPGRKYSFTKNSSSGTIPSYKAADTIFFTAKEADRLLGYEKSILAAYYDNEI